MSKYPLPEPQLDRTKKTPQAVDPNHGLWGFFGPEKKALATPEEEYAHGMLAKLCSKRNNSMAVLMI